MASRPSLITQRDVTRILKGAKAAGVDLAIVVVGREVRFVPAKLVAGDTAPSELDAWRRAHDAGEVYEPKPETALARFKRLRGTRAPTARRGAQPPASPASDRSA